MRVTAAVAPRMASGDPAGAKGKSASGASFGKRRVGREERCAQPPWPQGCTPHPEHLQEQQQGENRVKSMLFHMYVR
jgi:hypothetical protein